MKNQNIERRVFLHGAAAAGVLGALALTGCTPKTDTPSSGTAENPSGGSGGSTTTPATTPQVWVDAVASASVASNAYTNLGKEELLATINAFTAECVMATTNEDGTPNIAVFAGGAALKGEYIAFNWTDNQTKANLKRDKLGVIVFDVVNLSAETKEGRHQGAKVRVEYIDDEKIYTELKAESDRVVDVTIIVRIVEILPIG
jgi:hypothetical protein